jgi:hypothetical protein
MFLSPFKCDPIHRKRTTTSSGENLSANSVARQPVIFLGRLESSLFSMLLFAPYCFGALCCSTAAHNELKLSAEGLFRTGLVIYGLVDSGALPDTRFRNHSGLDLS